jgi:hypothetical protein
MSDTRAAAPVRSRLLREWTPHTPYTRGDLAACAQAGMRGLRIAERVRLDAEEPERTLGFVRLLIDAAGVGLRVYWQGTYDGVPERLLRHLDPPRDELGRPAWPVPPAPLLTVRHGPGFVQIDDLRTERPGRYVVPGEPYGQVLAAFAGPSRAASPEEATALEALAGRDLVLPLGGLHLSLPVRFKYARA